MVRLAQRIQCDQALGARDCRCVILLLFEERGETMQHLGDPPPVVFAQWREPVVVESRQKVVFIELRRGGEGLDLPRAIVLRSRGSGLGNRRLEINDVDRTGSVLPPSNREMIGHQPVAFGRQCSFQMVEKLPQIRPRLRFAGGRPQHKGQSLPRLRRIAMKDQICDQGLETVRVDRRDRASREADPQVAEQADPHGCCLRSLRRPNKEEVRATATLRAAKASLSRLAEAYRSNTQRTAG